MRCGCWRQGIWGGLDAGSEGAAGRRGPRQILKEAAAAGEAPAVCGPAVGGPASGCACGGRPRCGLWLAVGVGTKKVFLSAESVYFAFMEAISRVMIVHSAIALVDAYMGDGSRRPITVSIGEANEIAGLQIGLAIQPPADVVAEEAGCEARAGLQAVVGLASGAELDAGGAEYGADRICAALGRAGVESDVALRRGQDRVGGVWHGGAAAAGGRVLAAGSEAAACAFATCGIDHYGLYRKHPSGQALSHSLQLLLETAARYPLLDAAREIELGRQIREWLDWPGGEAEAPALVRKRGKRAMDEFLLSNLRLARFVSKRYCNRGVGDDDLMMAATEGLLAAIRRYRPALGYKFSSYGVWWAQQACQVLVAQQGGGVRLPTAVSEQLRRVYRTEDRLQRELGRDPSDAEIEAGAKLREGQLQALRCSARRWQTRSLDAGESCTLQDILTSDDDPEGRLESTELEGMLRGILEDDSVPLTLQQRYILRCRYLSDDPPTMPRLASRLNMNRMTVKRLEQRALQVLRQLLGEGTRDYLPS